MVGEKKKKKTPSHIGGKGRTSKNPHFFQNLGLRSGRGGVVKSKILKKSSGVVKPPLKRSWGGIGGLSPHKDLIQNYHPSEKFWRWSRESRAKLENRMNYLFRGGTTGKVI